MVVRLDQTLGMAVLADLPLCMSLYFGCSLAFSVLVCKICGTGPTINVAWYLVILQFKQPKV